MMAEQSREYFCHDCGRIIAGLSGDEYLGEGQFYCPRCLIKRAESYIEEPPPEKSIWRQLRETMAWKVALSLMAVASLVIIAYQTPRFLASWPALPPIRAGGVYATDAVTDACLKNLWLSIQERQQRRKGDGKALVCPASGRPYLVIPGANPEIHCPDPGRHGFRDVMVSIERPVPELKR